MTNLLSIVALSTNCLLVTVQTNCTVELSTNLIHWKLVDHWDVAKYGPTFGVTVEEKVCVYFRAKL